MTDTPGKTPTMTVTLERKAASQVALQVEATADEVEAAVQASLRRLAGRVRIAGFRPGKAPTAMVERAIGWETIRHETIDHLVPDLYRRAVDETGVEPVGDPELDLGELERDQPLKFTATVTIKPEVDLRDYLTLRVPMETTEITDATIDEAILEARRRHSEVADVDRAAQAGDVIRCTLVMRRGEEILTGGDGEERELELDRELVIPAIVDGVIGLTAGESRSFETTLPQDYRQEELRGATVTIDVTVHAVRERTLPPEDDALAVLDGHGPTLEDLREHYRTALAVEAAEADRERHEGAALEALRDYVRVDVPEAMIEREIDRQLADLEYRLTSLGLPARPLHRDERPDDGSAPHRAARGCGQPGPARTGARRPGSRRGDRGRRDRRSSARHGLSRKAGRSMPISAEGSRISPGGICAAALRVSGCSRSSPRRTRTSSRPDA